jgi:hypothetical protein
MASRNLLLDLLQLFHHFLHLKLVLFVSILVLLTAEAELA